MFPTSKSPLLQLLADICVNTSKKSQLFNALDAEIETVVDGMKDLAVAAVLLNQEDTKMAAIQMSGQMRWLDNLRAELRRKVDKA